MYLNIIQSEFILFDLSPTTPTIFDKWLRSHQFLLFITFDQYQLFCYPGLKILIGFIWYIRLFILLVVFILGQSLFLLSYIYFWVIWSLSSIQCSYRLLAEYMMPSKWTLCLESISVQLIIRNFLNCAIANLIVDPIFLSETYIVPTLSWTWVDNRADKMILTI